MRTIMFLFLLTACLSPQEAEQRQAARDAGDSAECAKLGFKPDSEKFADCRLRMKEMRLQQRIDSTSVTFNPYRGTPDSAMMH